MTNNWYALTDQEQKNSSARPFEKMANDRVRLEIGLRKILSTMSLSKEKIDTVINDLKSADFESLNLMKAELEDEK